MLFVMQLTYNQSYAHAFFCFFLPSATLLKGKEYQVVQQHCHQNTTLRLYNDLHDTSKYFFRIFGILVNILSGPSLFANITLYKVLFCKVLCRIAFLVMEHLDITQFVLCNRMEFYKILFVLC